MEGRVWFSRFSQKTSWLFLFCKSSHFTFQKETGLKACCLLTTLTLYGFFYCISFISLKMACCGCNRSPQQTSEGNMSFCCKSLMPLPQEFWSWHNSENHYCTWQNIIDKNIWFLQHLLHLSPQIPTVFRLCKICHVRMQMLRAQKFLRSCKHHAKTYSNNSLLHLFSTSQRDLSSLHGAKQYTISGYYIAPEL